MMKALGIGCFWFASRGSGKFNPFEHLEKIRTALESVDNVTDIEIDSNPNDINIDGWSYDDNDDEDENYFPIYSFVDIFFKIYLPQRVQETYNDDTSIEDVDSFFVHISYGFEFVVAYVSYDIPAGLAPEAADASTAVRLVREYLAAKLKDQKEVVFAFLGPSPFHVDIAIQDEIDAEETINCVKAVDNPGYDFFLFHTTSPERNHEVEQFAEKYGRTFECFYAIIRRRNRSFHTSGRILSQTKHLCNPSFARWPLRRRRVINDVFDAVLEHRMIEIDKADYVSKRKRDGDIDENSPFYKYVEAEIVDFATVPLDEVRDVLKISEERRQRSLANLTTVIAGLVGGIIGSLLTFVLTNLKPH